MKFFKKKFRRIFWQIMLKTPQFVRKIIIRSRFEINYNLDPGLEFKQAETKEDIEAALTLVYNAYLGLDYIEQNVQRLHFTKYLGLPTTTMLIIKFNQEVIGTMSIIPDSSLGLPCDTTWNLDSVRDNGKIAEISAFCIKKDFKSSKGHLLLPLCKLMVHFCREILQLDAIIIAATHEVEPFYTDLFLFKKINNVTGQKHSLVKGNESTCCYLLLGENLNPQYKKNYQHKELKKNLHYYYFIFKCPNIILPKEIGVFNSMNQEKNKNMMKLFIEKPLKIKNG